MLRLAHIPQHKRGKQPNALTKNNLLTNQAKPILNNQRKPTPRGKNTRVWLLNKQYLALKINMEKQRYKRNNVREVRGERTSYSKSQVFIPMVS